MFDELVRQKIELAPEGRKGKRSSVGDAGGTENLDLCRSLVSDDVVKLHRIPVRAALIKREGKTRPCRRSTFRIDRRHRLQGNIYTSEIFCPFPTKFISTFTGLPAGITIHNLLLFVTGLLISSRSSRNHRRGTRPSQRVIIRG